MNDPTLFSIPAALRGLALFDGARAKVCARCATVKPASEFPTRRSKTYSPSAYCYPCQREYSKDHYRRNKEKHNARRLRHCNEYRARNRRLIAEYLAIHHCVDCGEEDPVVLEFDHVRGTKRWEVSRFVGAGWAWSTVLEELAKCEVRCTNCHRRKTATQMSWKGRQLVDKEPGSHGR